MNERPEREHSPQDEFARANAGFGGLGGFDQIFSLRDYVSNLWRFRLLFAIAAVVGSLWAVYSVSHAPKLYTVSVLIGPVGDAPTASAGIGSLVSMFLSGGSMSQGPPEWSRYVFALNSVRLAERLNREHDLMHTVFASRWDEKTKRWNPTPGFDAAVSRFFHGLFGLPPDPPPTIGTLQQYISSTVNLNTDKQTGVTSLTSTSGDPKKALEFILMVHRAAVALVRQEIASRNSAKIAYLTKTIDETTNESQRTVLISMLEDTEKTQMLLNNNLPFAAQIIDTPVLSTVPSSPAPIQVTLVYRVGLLFFLLFGLIAFDQIAETNLVKFIDRSVRNAPNTVGRLIARFRERGYAGSWSGFDHFRRR